MNDLETMYSRILAEPADDTVRLAYADLLDENATADNGHAARAEFVRLQIERDRIGPPNEKLVLDYRMDGDFFRVEVTVDRKYPVGTRLDLWGKTCGLVAPALRVTSCRGDGLYGGHRLVLAADDHSLPYPAQRVKELDARLGFLFPRGDDPVPLWFREPPGVTGRQFISAQEFPRSATNTVFCTVPAGPCLPIHFRRGFASRLTASYDWWGANGDDWVRALPADVVNLYAVPDYHAVPRRAASVVLAAPSAYNFPGMPARCAVRLTRHALRSLRQKEGPAGADRVIATKILSARWPTVTEWRLTDFDEPGPDDPYEAPGN